MAGAEGWMCRDCAAGETHGEQGVGGFLGGRIGGVVCYRRSGVGEEELPEVLLMQGNRVMC